MNEDLPKTAQLFSKLIGREKTLILSQHSEHYRSVYIPKKLSKAKTLRCLIGDDATEILIHHFGGELLSLAACKWYRKFGRFDSEIIAMSKKGIKQSVIANRFGFSQGKISHVIKKYVFDIPHSALNRSPVIGSSSSIKIRYGFEAQNNAILDSKSAKPKF